MAIPGCALICVATSLAKAWVSPKATFARRVSGTGMPRIKYEKVTPCGVSSLNFGCFWAADFTAACTAWVNWLSEMDWACAIDYLLEFRLGRDSKVGVFFKDGAGGGGEGWLVGWVWVLAMF